jgi:spheroidene monooxygenase
VSSQPDLLAASPLSRTAAVSPPRDDVVVLLLSDMAPRWRSWGWRSVARGGSALADVPGLVFAKVLGSGYEGGFGLKPSWSRQGLFAVFDGLDAAAVFLAHGTRAQQLRQRSREHLVLVLRATSSRGSWSEKGIAPTRAVPATGLVASLTRASIKPTKAWPFWRRSPAAEEALAGAAGCQLAVGLGEAPLLRQCTFSLWEDQASMDAYARSGAHLQAIRASAAGGFFSESMFVRFVPLSVQGQWRGRHWNWTAERETQGTHDG